MNKLGSAIGHLLGRRKSAPQPVVGLDAGPEILEARTLLLAGKHDAAFVLLNRVKARRTPARYTDYLRAFYFLQSEQPVSAIEALKEELRWFPDNAAAAGLLQSLSPPASPKAGTSEDVEFSGWLGVIQPYTMLGPARLESLYRLAVSVCRDDVPGNFVECGVAAGGSSALLASVIRRHSRRPRQMYSFDTFSGMPAPSEMDIHEGRQAEDTGWGAGTCAAPESSLMEVSRKLGVENTVRPVKGFFNETLPAHRDEVGDIAFLHMDGDWYSSTRDILENLYDQVASGGAIQIDDYGYWEGCRRAVTDFEKNRGLKFQINRIDETGVWIVK